MRALPQSGGGEGQGRRCPLKGGHLDRIWAGVAGGREGGGREASIGQLGNRKLKRKYNKMSALGKVDFYMDICGCCKPCVLNSIRTW